jgi:hypothetical protein
MKTRLAKLKNALTKLAGLTRVEDPDLYGSVLLDSGLFSDIDPNPGVKFIRHCIKNHLNTTIRNTFSLLL